MADLSESRRQMVAQQIEERGVQSPAVARAMREVPREEFMAEEIRELAYADSPLPIGEGLSRQLLVPGLERAIGVIYRPQTEMASHYFQAVLPRQFDEYCWFDRTSAVRPLDTKRTTGMPETYPFGL